MAMLETPEYPEKIDAVVLKIAGVAVLGAIMSILDITVVNVALPTFQTVFGSVDQPIAYSHVAWTVTAYTVALAIAIQRDATVADQIGGPAAWPGGSPKLQRPSRAATGWQTPWRYSAVFFLPRKQEATHLLDDEGVPPVVVHGPPGAIALGRAKAF